MITLGTDIFPTTNKKAFTLKQTSSRPLLKKPSIHVVVTGDKLVSTKNVHATSPFLSVTGSAGDTLSSPHTRADCLSNYNIKDYAASQVKNVVKQSFNNHACTIWLYIESY